MVQNEMDIVIRRGIDEYCKRSNGLAQIRKQWFEGYWYGLGSGIIGLSIGILLGMILR